MRRLLLSSILLLLSAHISVATQVKWTANTANDNDPAATAPRSQKYWDENNIKRPDYAKTDSELFAEGKGGGGGGGITNLVLLVAVAAGASYYYKHHHQAPSGGERLQGGGFLSSSSKHLNNEELQKARLARFEAPDLSKFEAKDDW